MDLLLLGAGMGVVGGLMPSPLHLIALTQVALGRWGRAISILILPPLAIDGLLLVVTLFFYRTIPHNIAHYVSYAGGLVLLTFSTLALWELRHKSQKEMADSQTLTYASVTAASLAELTAPGTWLYWITVAGPILAEGPTRGYMTIAPFFAGGLVGYYGAAVVSLKVLAWGASLHRQFKSRLVLVANVLLFALGISYLLRAYFG